MLNILMVQKLVMDALIQRGIIVEIIDWNSIYNVITGVLNVEMLHEPFREIVAEIIRNSPLLLFL